MKDIMSIVLYGLLGVLLSMAGVSVMETPLEFFAILAIVIGIDVNAHYRGMKARI